MADERQEYAGYWRKSVGRKGIPQQRRVTLAFVEKTGGRIAFEKDDKDRTAYRAVSAPRLDRPGFNEILAWLRTQPAPRLAAWHVDRIARDIEDAEDVIRTRCYVLTVSGGSYDLATATGRKQFRRDVADATYEVDHGIERVLERKDEHAAEGRWLGGPVPFGWQAIPREDEEEPSLLELNATEAGLLRAAADEVLDGGALNAIAAEWNAAGWITRRGNPWGIMSLRQALLRPRNAGLMQHRGQVVRTAREDGAAQWPPLWDEVTHEALRSVLNDPARRTFPGGGRRHLLSGAALCGECGTPVKVRISGHVPYYACPRSARHPMRHRDRVDELVTEMALRRLEKPDAAALLGQDTGGERQALVARRARTEALMRSRGELHAQGLLSDTEFAAGRRQHLAELEEVRDMLGALDRTGELGALLASPREAWAKLDTAGKRAAVGALMAVTLFPGRRGRPKGYAGGPYFDYDSVDVRWLRSLPSDG